MQTKAGIPTQVESSAHRDPSREQTETRSRCSFRKDDNRSGQTHSDEEEEGIGLKGV
jgi:hypothetical protein